MVPSGMTRLPPALVLSCGTSVQWCVLVVSVVEALQGLVIRHDGLISPLKKRTVPLPAFILLDNLGPARGTVPFFNGLLCVGLTTPALGMIGQLPLRTNVCRY